MNNKLENWPKDWDLHLVHGFKAYFSKQFDLGVRFAGASFYPNKIVGENFDIDMSTINLNFELNGEFYIARLKLSEENNIIGSLSYIKIGSIGKEIHVCKDIMIEELPVCENDILIIYGDNVLSIAKEIEQSIWADYWKRNDDDDNNDDGDEVEPISPIDSLIELYS